MRSDASRHNILENFRNRALTQFPLHRRLGFLVMRQQPLLDVLSNRTARVGVLAVQREYRAGPDELIDLRQRNGRWLGNQFPAAADSWLRFHHPCFAQRGQYPAYDNRIRIDASRDKLRSQRLRLLCSEQAQDMNRDCKTAVYHTVNL